MVTMLKGVALSPVFPYHGLCPFRMDTQSRPPFEKQVHDKMLNNGVALEFNGPRAIA